MSKRGILFTVCPVTVTGDEVTFEEMRSGFIINRESGFIEYARDGSLSTS